MRLYFKQRMFSWFGKYEVFDEGGAAAFSVRGKPSIFGKLCIYDAQERELGVIKKVPFRIFPRFDLYAEGKFEGYIKKKMSFFHPRYKIKFKNWSVKGNIWEWDYRILDGAENTVAEIHKELFHLTDTYVLDIVRPADALYVLMFTLAVDIEKGSRNS